MLSALACVALAVLLAGPVQAKEAVSNEALSAEIARLSEAVERLNLLLAERTGEKEEEAALLKLDIAVSYLNFRYRSIEIKEMEVREKRDLRGRIADTIDSIDKQREERARQAEEQFQSLPAQTTKEQEEFIEIRRKQLAERLTKLDGEIIVLENEIIDLKGQLQSTEAFVRKNLNFIP
ncbi:MAG: hypothetical protein C0617_02070 [Desulfuromonas sp.]|nr:MAG: hypothetical protein C0617_02070 [Desulfuromonas sp.]